MSPREESIGWLTCLIVEYERLYKSHAADDEDPLATLEMLREVSALRDELAEEDRQRRNARFN